MDITLVLGDITEQHVDAIVNAANSSLLGGGGVDGAIHRRGGPEILAECRQLRAGHYGGGLPAGQAVATTAGRLPARWVIHTVGPVYSAAEDRSGILASCYEESLRVAAELGARTVAFPAVSAGIYGWPADSAARIAVGTVRRSDAAIEEARFVLFTQDVYAAFERALADAGTANGLRTVGSTIQPATSPGPRPGRASGVSAGTCTRVTGRRRTGGPGRARIQASGLGA